MGRKAKKPTIPEEDNFIVINKYGEVYIGLLGGQPQFSLNWSLAKPLHKQNTTLLLRNKDNEIINTKEL